MSIMEVSAVLLVLSAVIGWLNSAFLKLPHSVAMLGSGMLGSMLILAVDEIVPGFEFARYAHSLLTSVDFFETVMSGMLAFLLFAGALHVDLDRIKEMKWPIAAMASFGVVISTFVIGAVMWSVCAALELSVPFVWCLVFGALISPTDPVAVLSVLKTVQIDPKLEIKIAGESLFNDGVAVVVYTVMLAVALATQGWGGDLHGGIVDAAGKLDWLRISEVAVTEVGGAILFGTFAGVAAMEMMRRVDDAGIETLISLALVLATSVWCSDLHISSPIAVVVEGLIIGNFGPQRAMSERTRNHLFPFWTLVDEILNSVLFLLIGMEAMIIRFDEKWMVPAILCIPVVLLARFVSVAVPLRVLSRLKHQFATGAIRMMTWGGVRGGISVALALSLPYSEHKGLILMATYLCVVFSIIVQGLTIAPLARALTKEMVHEEHLSSERKI